MCPRCCEKKERVYTFADDFELPRGTAAYLACLLALPCVMSNRLYSARHLSVAVCADEAARKACRKARVDRMRLIQERREKTAGATPAPVDSPVPIVVESKGQKRGRPTKLAIAEGKLKKPKISIRDAEHLVERIKVSPPGIWPLFGMSGSGDGAHMAVPL